MNKGVSIVNAEQGLELGRPSSIQSIVTLSDNSILQHNNEKLYREALLWDAHTGPQQLPQLIDVLVGSGFDDAVIRRFLGENFYRVAAASWLSSLACRLHEG